MQNDKRDPVRRIRFLDRFEFKVVLIIVLTALCTASLVFMVMVLQSRQSTINAMRSQSQIIAGYTLGILDRDLFYTVTTEEDAKSPAFLAQSQQLDEMRRVSGLKYMYTMRVNEQGLMIYMVDGQPMDTADYCPFGTPVEADLLSDVWSAMNGHPVLASKVRDTGYGPVYTSFWPVFAGDGTVVGLLGLEYDAATLTKLDSNSLLVSLMVTLMLIVVMGVGSVIAFKQVSIPFRQELAYTDVLTGMNNRTAFEMDIKRVQAEGRHKNSSMIIFDLNDLKLVNDTYGHSRGDEYLKIAASLIQDCFWGYGEAYRIGGDEFAVLCIGQEEMVIYNVLSGNFEQYVEEAAAAIDGKFPHRWFSIAYGVAFYTPEQHASLRELYEDADAKMYQMKKNMKANARV